MTDTATAAEEGEVIAWARHHDVPMGRVTEPIVGLHASPRDHLRPGDLIRPAVAVPGAPPLAYWWSTRGWHMAKRYAHGMTGLRGGVATVYEVEVPQGALVLMDPERLAHAWATPSPLRITRLLPVSGPTPRWPS